MSSVSLGLELAKYLIFTILVLFLAVLATRLWVRRLRPVRAGAYLGLVEGLALGPKQGVYLVRAADQVLVLGVTEASITLLGTISGAAADLVAAPPDSEGQSPLSGWLERGQEWIERIRKRGGRP